MSPPTLSDIVVESKDLTILEAGLTASGLLPFFFDDEFEYTVLAPIDDAFASFATVHPELFEVLLDDGWILHLLDILTMHITEPALFSSNLTNVMELEMFNLEIVTVSVANGGVCFSPSVNGSACVVVPDVAASNGVAHVVDDVIKPFWIDFTVKDVAAALTPTLFKLLECAGLADALDTFGITVFAPSDEALAELDAAYLCGEGLPTLIEILTYHVVPKVIPSIIIPMGMTDLPTLQGSDVTVTYKPDDGVLMVNDANIVDFDWGVKNGFLHVIDGLLVPPAPASGKGKGPAPAPASGKGKGKGKGKGPAPAPASGKGKGKGKGKGPAPAPAPGKGMAPSKGMMKMMMAPMGKGMSMAPKGKGKA
jgi:transforming growth factor-beta-induced protein